MEKVIIDGGVALEGSISVSGMKNAAVAVLFASVLVGDVCTIENLPDISDVNISLQILESVGVKVERLDATSVRLDSTHATDTMPPQELVKKMRASYYLVGASLGRFGHAAVPYPGGCDFGKRPIDQHLKAFNALGAVATETPELIEATATGKRLKGANILFDCPTVGGTMNAIMAAVLAVQIAFVYLGGDVLRSAPLTPSELFYTFFVSLLVFPAEALRKLLWRFCGRSDGF